MRSLTMGELYRMLQQCHNNLLDRDKWPQVAEMETGYLDEIDRALWGSLEAVKGLRTMVQRELQARGENVFSMPLRLVPDPDPEKNRGRL